MAQIAALDFAPDVSLVLQANAAVMRALQQQIAVLEERLAERVQLNADFALLKSVLGVGQVLATMIMLETGTVARFARVGNFSSYCRCVQSVRISNGKKKGEGNAKNGNHYLGWAEAAHFALRNCPQAKSFYERKTRRAMPSWQPKRSHTKARACYHILREHKPFEVARCFFLTVWPGTTSQETGLEIPISND